MSPVRLLDKWSFTFSWKHPKLLYGSFATFNCEHGEYELDICNQLGGNIKPILLYDSIYFPLTGSVTASSRKTKFGPIKKQSRPVNFPVASDLKLRIFQVNIQSNAGFMLLTVTV